MNLWNKLVLPTVELSVFHCLNASRSYQTNNTQQFDSHTLISIVIANNVPQTASKTIWSTCIYQPQSKVIQEVEERR